MNYKLSILTLIIILLLGACNKNDDDNEQPLSYDMTCIPSSLHSNVIAFYPFSKGSLDDFSANTNDLSNLTTAKPASDRNNNPVCAYQFKNDNTIVEYLITRNTAFLNNLNEFSVSLWYMPLDTSRKHGGFESLLSRDSSISCPDRMGQWSLSLYDCRRAVFGGWHSVWDSLILPLGAGFSCTDEVATRTDKWHFATAVYNSTTQTMEIYRNGILQDTEVGMSTCSIMQVVKDIGDLFIGLKYTGVIDDIIIFNKALSQSEISQLYQMEPCCSEN